MVTKFKLLIFLSPGRSSLSTQPSWLPIAVVPLAQLMATTIERMIHGTLTDTVLGYVNVGPDFIDH